MNKRSSQMSAYFVCSCILLCVFFHKENYRQRGMSSTLQAIVFAFQLNYCTECDRYFIRNVSHFHILHSYSEMLPASPRR
jgi:hypothetical protein